MEQDIAKGMVATRPSPERALLVAVETRGVRGGWRVGITVDELAQLAASLETVPTDMAALYKATLRISQAGLDLNNVLAEVAEAVFALLKSATHLTILLSDEQAERFTPVVARVSRRETIEWAGRRVDCHVVELETVAKTSAWVDGRGRVIVQEGPMGVRIVRDPDEGA